MRRNRLGLRNVSYAYPGKLGITTDKGQQNNYPLVLDAPTESYETMLIRWQTGVYEVGANAPVPSQGRILGIPVIIVLSGGIPVTQLNYEDAPPPSPSTPDATASSNDYGIKITLVASGGIPMNIFNLDGTPYQPVLEISTFGPLGNGTVGRETLRRAVNTAVSSNRTLIIDTDVPVDLSDPSHPIELLDNLRMRYIPNKWIDMIGFGLPLFYKKNARNIKIDSPNIRYTGTASTTLPMRTAIFRDQIYPGLPSRDVMAAFAFYGTDNVRIISPNFVATDFSHSNKFIPRAIVTLPSPEGNLIVNTSITGTMVLDGVLMGWLNCGYNSFELGNVLSRHWGNLDPAVYTWDVANHAVYTTAFGGYGSSGLITGTLTDAGEEPASKPYTANGPFSFKFVSLENFNIGRINSVRSGGALEARLGVKNGTFANDNVADCRGGVAADVFSGTIYIGAASPAELVPEMVTDVNFGTWTIYPPQDGVAATFSGSNAITGSEVVPNVVADCQGQFGVVYNYASRIVSTPLFRGRLSDCDFDVSLTAPNLPTSPSPSYVLFAVDGGGVSNTVNAQFNGPSIQYTRVVETVGAGVSNVFNLSQVGTGSTRVLNTIELVPYPLTPADWTLRTGWSINAQGKAVFAAPSQSASYDAASLRAGVSYDIQYTIESISGGQISVNAGTTTGIIRNAPGTYTETLIAAGNTGWHIQPRNGTTPSGVVSNISVRRTV